MIKNIVLSTLAVLLLASTVSAGEKYVFCNEDKESLGHAFSGVDSKKHKRLYYIYGAYKAYKILTESNYVATSTVDAKDGLPVYTVCQKVEVNNR